MSRDKRRSKSTGISPLAVKMFIERNLKWQMKSKHQIVKSAKPIQMFILKAQSPLVRTLNQSIDVSLVGMKSNKDDIYSICLVVLLVVGMVMFSVWAGQ